MFILLMVLKETDNHHRPLLCRLQSVGNHVPDVSIVQEWTIWMSIYLQIYRYPSIATLFAPSSWSTFRQEQETTEATHLLNAIPHRRILSSTVAMCDWSRQRCWMTVSYIWTPRLIWSVLKYIGNPSSTCVLFPRKSHSILLLLTFLFWHSVPSVLLFFAT